MTADDAAGSSASGGPLFLRTREEWRAWFDAHAATATEVVVGVWKKGSGRPSISWPELVEEALCVGWIDGVRRGIGDDAYSIRFTPRRPGSHWSRVNVDLVTRLEAEGRMTEAGRAAFAARREDRTAKASYERTAPAVLDADQEAAFRAEPVAWQWFCAAPASYRRVATHWVVSAKRPETRARRLAALVESSREGRRLRQFDPRA